jgi:hypothetical protein
MDVLREKALAMTKSTFLPIVAALVLAALAGGNVKDLGPRLPAEIAGWKAAGADHIYDRKTIFDYLDGGAEVYLAFDLREVFVRKFKSAAGTEIALDIYDCGSPAEAFGAFTCDRQDPGAGIGQESEYGPGLLRFWQGRFFVSITAAGDEEKAEVALRALGKDVVPVLGPAGEPPALVRALPDAGLKKDRTCFFHSVINLNNRFFVAADNILNLEALTDCVLAEYDAGGQADPARLLLVVYPDEGRAQAAELSFAKGYRPADAAAGANSGARAFARRRSNLLSIVFAAPSKAFAKRLLAAVKQPQP